MRQAFHNAHHSEVPVVVSLIECLKLKGAVVTLGALHCEKNTNHHP